MSDSIKRICLWSSPRNVSTAFMYSWAQRPDTLVVDEPLYGYYLHKTQSKHPGKKEILKTMDLDANSVIKNMCSGQFERPVVFFKHMTHHTVLIDLTFMQHLYNLFFIRNPMQIIHSYSKVISNPTIEDIGMKMQWEFYQFAIQKGYKSIVLDSGELLKDPESVLKNLCFKIGIPFYTTMLDWHPGPRPEDGIWAKFWYHNVHQSAGFEKPQEVKQELPAHLIPLYLEAKPFYDQLYQYSLKA